jgi:hypothetical protein
MTCPRCSGFGIIDEVPCGLCTGAGTVSIEQASSYVASEQGFTRFMETVDDPDQPWSPKRQVVARRPLPQLALVAPAPAVHRPGWWQRLWTWCRSW